jgi:surfeit locus 1 family protein
LTGKRVAAVVLFDLVAILIVAGLVSLAIWQTHRRAWKLDLVSRIEARVHAPPTAAPGPERWPAITAATDEYRRVTAAGRWLADRSALVQAVTELGGGYWLLTPLLREDGTILLVNRGFVPKDGRDSATLAPPDAGPTTVTGLLRLSEPGGAFLRSNDPGSDRWFSRDVATIAASRGLTTVAPYFIDAERVPGQSGFPVAGLTVLSFPNNHLVYALTWGALALMAEVARFCEHRSAAARPAAPRALLR